MSRLAPPGKLDDLSEANKEVWSQIVSRWLDEAREGNPRENNGPRHQFFNPLTSPPANDAQVAVIAWNAFPRQVKSNSLSDRQRWRRADADRNVQDEYCEWSVTRDPATRRIERVTFTCEPPEYWQVLASLDPDKVLELYREFVSPAIRREDLFINGKYNPRNRFNSTTTGGAMHLVQLSNKLGAEIELGAAATIRRSQGGHEIIDAQALILCSAYGEPGRNSDPHIGEQINALARQRADITLNNPIGLYFHEFNPVGWTTPDGEDARSFWHYPRGDDGHRVRAVFEVPAERGYGIGDIRIAGKPIEFGAQIADYITMKLEGVATRIGQSTAEVVSGCRVAAEPPSHLAATPPGEFLPKLPLQSRRSVSHGQAAGEGLAAMEGAPEEERVNALIAGLPGALQRDLEAETAAAAPPALLPYPMLPPERFKPRLVSGKIMAYASPDSTYAATKKLIDAAQRSLVIGIYDFSASYMKDHLKRAMHRGVALSLMLDTNSADETSLFGELQRLGANCVKAPSQSSGNPIAYFGNAHEKIIVVDGEIVMIQSGNWSENSIPFNEGDGVVAGSFAPGNRDMGLAVQSKELAQFFSDLVARDMRLSRGEPADSPPSAIAAAPEGIAASEFFFEAAPPQAPKRLFSSLSVTPSSPVRITPVVTPENFNDTVGALLRSATRSIRMEQQYIRGHQPVVEALLREINQARQANPELTIQIIVSPKFLVGDDLRRFEQSMERFDLQFDEHYRFLSLAHFVHCHNKLIVVDEEKVLLGSQNWSTSGIASNREASLLVEHAGIAAYFAEIFDADWDVSESATMLADIIAVGPENLRRPSDFAQGHVVASSTRDYADV